MTTNNTWKVNVIYDETGETIKTFEALTERSANRLENGLNINLDHNRYYTSIEAPKEQS